MEVKKHRMVIYHGANEISADGKLILTPTANKVIESWKGNRISVEIYVLLTDEEFARHKERALTWWEANMQRDKQNNLNDSM